MYGISKELADNRKSSGGAVYAINDKLLIYDDEQLMRGKRLTKLLPPITLHSLVIIICESELLFKLRMESLLPSGVKLSQFLSAPGAT